MNVLITRHSEATSTYNGSGLSRQAILYVILPNKVLFGWEWQLVFQLRVKWMLNPLEHSKLSGLIRQVVF